MAGSTVGAGEAYEKILTANLQRAIDFVKFAETKNAALLALASAWVVASINIESSGKAIPSGFSTSVPLTLLVSVCAGCTAMISFLPKLHLPKFLGGRRAGPHPKNLLYFGDICTLPIKTLEQDLHARYLPDGKGPRDEYIHDLIVQISVNSEIALRKMHLFLWGLRLMLLAGAVLLVPSAGLAFRAVKSLW
jgi:hypothetical protein